MKQRPLQNATEPIVAICALGACGYQNWIKGPQDKVRSRPVSGASEGD